MFYVYRFLDEDFNVVYVGRTANLSNRMNQHFNGGHLTKEQYDSVQRVDYLELKTKNDMKIKELYYIGKYRPKYNKIDNFDVSFEMDEMQDVWVSYSRKKMDEHFEKSENDRLIDEKIREHYESQIRELQEQLEESLSREKSYKEQLERALEQQHVEYRIQGVQEKTRYISYGRMVKMLKTESRLRGVTIVDSKIGTVLRKKGEEILADCHLNKGESTKTLILDSPDRKRELRIYPQAVAADIGTAMSVLACEHWEMAWEKPPYRNPKKVHSQQA